MARTGTILAVVCATLLTEPVRAQSGSDPSALLSEALREYAAGNYEEAHALFLRVHQMRPDARTQRALGKTAFELRRYVEAIGWLEAALADDRNPLTPDLRNEVQGLLDRARSFVGRLRITTNVESASIEVDGNPVRSPSVPVSIGEHEIVARAQGYEPVRRRVTVRGGEELDVELTLQPVAPAGGTASGPAATVTTVVRDDPHATRRVLGIVGLITGGVLIIGGGVATAIWQDQVNRLNAAIEGGTCVVDDDEQVVPGADPACFDFQSRYRLARTLAWVGFGTGALLAGAGLFLVLSASGDAEEESHAMACLPYGDIGVACTVRF
ncbi:MAG: PEGA domain-containing protein [Myxococcota bacterium]|nr:PEGA domain-containing protein [Myxococcota bacterium]MDW8363690.1 PEGA domain-containing protein [Myxococcales bacterium]